MGRQPYPRQDPQPSPTPTLYPTTPIPEVAQPVGTPQVDAYGIPIYPAFPIQNQGTFTDNLLQTATPTAAPSILQAAGPTPSQTPIPTPIDPGTGAATATGTPTAQNIVWDTGFQEGFNAGFNASMGRADNTPSSIAIHDEQYNSAFQLGFQAGYKSGNQSGGDPGAVPAPEVPYGSSALGINAVQAAALWENNPALAISMGGTAQPGTPGYNSLSQLNFHPENILLAANMLGDPVQNLQNSMDLYSTMGSKGGAMVNAPALLSNMAYATADSDFGAAVAQNPAMFAYVGRDVLIASGAHRYTINAFDQQMQVAYAGYGQYLMTTGANQNPLPFNTWLVQNHPDMVASWGK